MIRGDADFTSLNSEIESKAVNAGGYFGLKMAPGMTGLPVDLILDGQASHSWIAYDQKDNSAGTTGSFDSGRFAGSVNVTAVILRHVANGTTVRVLPKLGVTYLNEKQDAYRDSGGNAIPSQKITLGQLTFGTQVFVPVAQWVELFGRVEGQWDFDNVGALTTVTGGTYKPGDFGAIIGVGFRATVSENMTLRVEGATEGLGRDDYDQYTGSARIDMRF